MIKWTLGLAVAVVLTTVLLALILAKGEPIPEFNGRTVYEWLALMEHDDPAQVEQYRAATHAIIAQGAEAVPCLATVIAPPKEEKGFIKQVWSEIGDILGEYFDDLPLSDGDPGPSSYRAAMALTLIQPEGIICLTNLLAQDHDVAGWGLVQNPRSRNWPGV